MAYPTFEDWYRPEINRYDKRSGTMIQDIGGGRMRYAPSPVPADEGGMWNDYDVPGPPRAFKTGGGMELGDMLDDGGNKRAKLMREMNAKARSLRKLGFDAPEIEVLIRGQFGRLRPQDAELFQSAWYKLVQTQRVTDIPGMTKSLRGYPGKGGGGDSSAEDAMRGMGFGGGGQMGLDEMLR